MERPVIYSLFTAATGRAIMRAAAGAMIAALLLAGVGRAQADDHGRITLEEENDFFAPDNRDRHYTQGAQLNYLSPDLGADGMAAPMTWLGSLLPVFQDGSATTSRRFDLFVGQELFTPQNKRLHDPDPRDRPYAGWLNGGIGFIQDADEQTLDHLEVQVGLVGPGALGKQTQNNFHLAIDNPESEGWGFQLRNEPTLNFYYDRHRRFIAELDGGLSVDLIPAASVAVGNAFDYLGVGTRARFGQNLKVDYGPPRIGPGPSGTDYFNRDYLPSDSLFGWYVFVGTEGRVVGHNIFLDGNSFVASRSVRRRPLVGDLEAGMALFYSDWVRLSYSYLYRSDEFYGQHNGDNFGAITLSFRVPF
jgi:lipid A 3-O-deacylase